MARDIAQPQPQPEMAPTWQLAEDAPAPEVLVDGYASLLVHNGNIKLTCFTIEHDAVANKQRHRINLRLTMPLAGAVGFAQALSTELQRISEAMAQQQAQALEAVKQMQEQAARQAADLVDITAPPAVKVDET